MSSRSANDRERPVSGFAHGASGAGAIPPASRNHRAPIAGETEVLTAAASLVQPAAMAAQNRHRSLRRAACGRPGERSLGRPARSDRRLCVFITTPFIEVFRRPVESTQYTSGVFQKELAAHQAVCGMSGKGDCWDNAVPESFFATLKRKLVDGRVYETRAQARGEVFEYVEVYDNRKRLRSKRLYLTPVEAERQALVA
jgi:transposase InsO family protein